MDSRYTLQPRGSSVTQDIKRKNDRKYIKLLAAKKTIYIEVNTPSTNHI